MRDRPAGTEYDQLHKHILTVPPARDLNRSGPDREKERRVLN
jgi:hypothetical protein